MAPKVGGGGKVDMKTTNFRLGYKTAGDLYLRIEMGYGIGDVPLTLIYKAVDISLLIILKYRKTQKLMESQKRCVGW